MTCRLKPYLHQRDELDDKETSVKMSKILVTGGAGFIGSQVAEALANARTSTTATAVSSVSS